MKIRKSVAYKHYKGKLCTYNSFSPSELLKIIFPTAYDIDNTQTFIVINNPQVCVKYDGPFKTINSKKRRKTSANSRCTSSRCCTRIIESNNIFVVHSLSILICFVRQCITSQQFKVKDTADHIT